MVDNNQSMLRIIRHFPKSSEDIENGVVEGVGGRKLGVLLQLMSNGECAVKMSSVGQGEEVISCVSRSGEGPLRGGPSIGELAGSRHACAIVLVGYDNCSCTEGQKMEDCEQPFCGKDRAAGAKESV